MKMKTKILALCGAAAAATSLSSAANAHMVQFGWKDNGNGSTTLYAEHWHGNLATPSASNNFNSDNGGLKIWKVGDPMSSAITVQWGSVANDTPKSAFNLTGFSTATGNSGANSYNDWLITAPLTLGNGNYNFFTGTNCCTDTMSSAIQFTVTGVTSVGDGQLSATPGAVPEPATWAMMIGGFGMVGGAMRSARRRTKVSVSFA